MKKNLSSTPSFQKYTCNNCQNRKDPQYTFNSTILTIIITALGFLTAFSWNQYIKEAFEHMTDKHDELQARFNYAVLATFFAIAFAFILMYNLNGTKY